MVDLPTTKQLSPSRRLWWDDEVEACSFSFISVQWNVCRERCNKFTFDTHSLYYSI